MILLSRDRQLPVFEPHERLFSFLRSPEAQHFLSCN